MEYIAINSIGEYPEDFLFAKVDIEKKMIEDGIIEKRMKLDDFIIMLNIQDKVYMNNQHGIAFSIMEGQNDTYIFYSLLDSDINNNELTDSFKKKLELLNYKFDTLKHLEPMELIEEDVLSGELFIMKSVICK